jgi:hypothetical protein
VLDTAKGPTALPCFFWFRRWLNEDNGLVASVPMTTRPSFEEAQRELLERRKRDVLGIHEFRPINEVVPLVLAVAGDARESKRQWKTIDPDDNGTTH